jgi:hypothetical protein
MEEELGAWCVGILVLVLGIVGIILAAHARDDGMYVFGWSLAGFAVAFLFNLVSKSPLVSKTLPGARALGRSDV